MCFECTEKWKRFKKKSQKSRFDFENIGTLIRYGIYPSSISSEDFWVLEIQNTQEL